MEQHGELIPGSQSSLAPSRLDSEMPLGDDEWKEFLVPLPPVPKEPLRSTPEDSKVHNEGCLYFRWNVTYRTSLVSTEGVIDYLVDFEKRTRGRKYFEANKETVTREAKEKAGRTAVKKYLRGSEKKYDRFKDMYLKMCTCFPVPIVDPHASETEGVPVNGTEEQSQGLNLSEDSDDDRMDTDTAETDVCSSSSMTDQEQEQVVEGVAQNGGIHFSGFKEQENIPKVNGDIQKENSSPENVNSQSNLKATASRAVFESCGLQLSSDEELDYECDEDDL